MAAYKKCIVYYNMALAFHYILVVTASPECIAISYHYKCFNITAFFLQFADKEITDIVASPYYGLFDIDVFIVGKVLKLDK